MLITPLVPNSGALAAPPASVPLPEDLRVALAKRHMDKLDGVRAIAAFLVVFFHFGLPVPAGFGVMAFFVLSGFLITWLMLQEDARSGTVSLRAFYARRALRIFPAFYCYWFLVTGFILITHRQFSWGQAAASFAYVCNYYQGLNGYPSSVYSHTWSLGVEEQFYLLFPLLFLLLRKWPRRRVAVLVAAIIAVWALRIVGTFVLKLPENYIYTAFEMRADHLLIGCLLAILLHSGMAGACWRHLVLYRRTYLVLTMCALAASVYAQAAVGIPYRNTVGFIVDPILVAILITLLLASGNRSSVRWMDSRLLRYLGTISYPIYLYQQVVIWPVRRQLNAYGMPTIVTAIASSVAVIACAAASYHFVEKPFLRLKGRLSRLPTRETGSSAATETPISAS